MDELWGNYYEGVFFWDEFPMDKEDGYPLLYTLLFTLKFNILSQFLKPKGHLLRIRTGLKIAFEYNWFKSTKK